MSTRQKRARLVATLLEIRALDRVEYERLMTELRESARKARAN